MSKRRTQLSGILALSIGFMAAGAMAAGVPVTLLSEDFEAYAPGTSIAGQGGWYALNPSQAPIMVATGNGIASLVLDGGIRTGDGAYTVDNFPSVFHSLSAPLSGTSLTTLSADAYAFDSYHSHAAGVGFSSADGGLQFVWFSDWYTGTNGPKWAFQTVGLGSVVDRFSGGFDQPISLEVIVDGFSGEVYGRLTHSGGTYETPHVAITSEQLASLTEVVIMEDYRDSLYLGAEFDNVRVITSEQVPTVTTWGMLALVLCVLVAGTVVFRRRAAA